VESINVRPADATAGGVISIAHVITGAQFALDDENGAWQSASVFEGVTAGEHKLYIRDGDGCPNQYDVYVPPLRTYYWFSFVVGAAVIVSDAGHAWQSRHLTPLR
jgi:hypothetical protein